MNPLLMQIVGTAVVAAVLAALIAVSIHNGIIRRKNQVIRAWSDVVAFERQKLKTLPLIEESLADYKEYEGALLQSVTALRTAAGTIDPKRPDPAALARVESQSATLMKQLQVSVEAYPQLKASHLFLGYLRELTELQANIRAAIGVFNGNVEVFNSGIQTWPGSLVNAKITQEVAITPFSDTEASGEIEYRPNF